MDLIVKLALLMVVLIVILKVVLYVMSVMDQEKQKKMIKRLNVAFLCLAVLFIALIISGKSYSFSYPNFSNVFGGEKQVEKKQKKKVEKK